MQSYRANQKSRSPRNRSNILKVEELNSGEKERDMKQLFEVASKINTRLKPFQLEFVNKPNRNKTKEKEESKCG